MVYPKNADGNEVSPENIHLKGNHKNYIFSENKRSAPISPHFKINVSEHSKNFYFSIKTIP